MKTIHATLLTHLALPVTTTCLLVRVECVGAYAGTIYGFTSLDTDVTYDDGAGSVLYRSDNGFTPKRLAHDSGPGTDSSEIEGAVASGGIEEAPIRAGIFKSAKVTFYRVNYNDLTSGRHEVVDYGRLGQTRYTEIGWVTEFRSLSQLLKQVITEVYSIPCNAKYGDARCGKALVWDSGTVTGLGSETDREFEASGISEVDDFYRLGVLLWTSGDNVGHECEIDTYTVGTFALSLGLPYAIQVGDEFDVRQDCDKSLAMCRDVHANKDNHRGFPLMPIDGTAMVPGAEIDRA